MQTGDYPLIDFQVLGRLSDLLTHEDLKDMLERSLEYLIELSGELEDPLTSQELGQLSHKSKGSMGAMGLSRFSHLAQEIEWRCAEDQATDQDQSQLAKVVLDTCSAIESVLQTGMGKASLSVQSGPRDLSPCVFCWRKTTRLAVNS